MHATLRTGGAVPSFSSVGSLVGKIDWHFRAFTTVHLISLRLWFVSFCVVSSLLTTGTFDLSWTHLSLFALSACLPSALASVLLHELLDRLLPATRRTRSQ